MVENGHKTEKSIKAVSKTLHFETTGLPLLSYSIMIDTDMGQIDKGQILINWWFY